MTHSSNFVITDSDLIRLRKLDKIDSSQSRTGPFQGTPHCHKELHKDIHKPKPCLEQRWSKH